MGYDQVLARVNELRTRIGEALAPASSPAGPDAATAAMFQRQMTAATLSSMAAAEDPNPQNAAAQQSFAVGGATANPYAALQSGGLNTQAAMLAQLQSGASGSAASPPGGLDMNSLLAALQNQQAVASPTAPGFVRGKTSGLDQELLGRLDALGRELGQPIDIISGNRTRAEQAALYQKYLNGTGNLAAPPGQSNHERGAAADAYVNGAALANVPGAREAAQRLGLHFPVGGEAWHVERNDSSPR